MTAMTMDFDGVRELSLEEVEAVAGGWRWLGRVVIESAVGAAVLGAGRSALEAGMKGYTDGVRDRYVALDEGTKQGLAMARITM